MSSTCLRSIAQEMASRTLTSLSGAASARSWRTWKLSWSTVETLTLLAVAVLAVTELSKIAMSTAPDRSAETMAFSSAMIRNCTEASPGLPW